MISITLKIGTIMNNYMSSVGKKILRMVWGCFAVCFISAGQQVYAIKTKVASKTIDYNFDKTMSREVLENYLSRSISMEGMFNGRGDLADNIRMLKTTGAKFIGSTENIYPTWLNSITMVLAITPEKKRLARFLFGFGVTTKSHGLHIRANNIVAIGCTMPGIGYERQMQMDISKCLAAAP
jgi:hypothetical protein